MIRGVSRAHTLGSVDPAQFLKQEGVSPLTTERQTGGVFLERFRATLHLFFQISVDGLSRLADELGLRGEWRDRANDKKISQGMNPQNPSIL
ncbi:hypothetical protein Tco_0505147 [Tanacetum coccineum]